VEMVQRVKSVAFACLLRSLIMYVNAFYNPSFVDVVLIGICCGGTLNLLGGHLSKGRGLPWG